MDASPHFLLLAATLLDSSLDDDTTLLQLHAVFGPMLLSAMQLVDRREVVHVDLGGRGLYQVSSSAGAPYTLYLDLPELPPPPAEDPRPETVEPPEENAGEAVLREATEQAARVRAVKLKAANDARLRANAEKLRHMYCPCTGWAFNALEGRHIFCKHVLAVLLAHRLGQTVRTRVGVHAAAGLLGISA
ncbi:hypothetical protein CC85DRAFT_281582 [Cutaneotrichosporon oleaginosum]|uniref:SWIM-type domain-containing protein n=1 Tax=Cutaneotrichosporon oleaginosum TaxID=879819 RepID=A0A0J1BED9_9TREE|nr:uncharacterized protein CC85DRAFT_281582 [Cutaneotrichosporon oleaginosum]KLT46474.1 hypothetical protein CC85DRAFT_281582 [Cutaneotrichosporon oleaginosum]TXT15158.1 hypothetical protein COLE_01351 [Cutaneotrichosporon oleaginosum]